jgi:hypothetical protein
VREIFLTPLQDGYSAKIDAGDPLRDRGWSPEAAVVRACGEATRTAKQRAEMRARINKRVGD